MPKITEISVSYGVTKNLGNYESLRLDVQFKADVADDESVDDVFKRLILEAREKIHETASKETDVLENW